MDQRSRAGPSPAPAPNFASSRSPKPRASRAGSSSELEERLPGFDQQLKLNITGCPNSCGQHWIADIGIEGKKIKVDGRMVDAYYFCVGGAVGKFASIARPVGYRCPATEVPDAIERLLNQFQLVRLPGENLRQFFARHSNDEIRALLSGEIRPPGRPRLSYRPGAARGGRLMSLLPIFLKLRGRRVLVVGGGNVAESKIESLLLSEAEVHVVAPELNANVSELARAGKIAWRQKSFEPRRSRSASSS